MIGLSICLVILIVCVTFALIWASARRIRDEADRGGLFL